MLSSLFWLSLLPLVHASPYAQPGAAAAAAPQPQSTPSLVQLVPSKTRRGLTDDIKSVLGDLGSNIPSYVADGVANFFQELPVGDGVKSSLGIDDSQLAALPTQVLNIPSYGNWTDDGWNLRFRGNVYKQPEIEREKLDDLANIFLIDVDIEDLPSDEADRARNLTSEIFVVQQGDLNVSFHLEPAPSFGSSGEPGGGGAVTPEGGEQDITLPYPTTDQGDFDVFLPIENPSGGLQPGNDTSELQRLNVYADGTDSGNATSYLVPTDGLTIISDIDDILRVTKIYLPKQGLLNSFARPFTPWLNMPDVYANWSRSIPDLHFHYLTTTPEQATRVYMQFIYSTYPGGSFDTRPLNFSDVSATLSIRKFLLTKIFETFPQRKFVLVADTSNSDVMKAYPQMAIEFPDQLQCIFIRNVSATDPEIRFPYDTSVFEEVDRSKYIFFQEPDDIKGLDILNGQCVNDSIPQDVTFGLQNLPFGIDLGDGDEPEEDAATSIFGTAGYRGLLVPGAAALVTILVTTLFPLFH